MKQLGFYLSFIGMLLTASTAHALLLGPSSYLSFSDSPFAGDTFSYFHLEDFEDGLFNVPGVTASAGGVTSVVFGPNFHDSVDADDGSIDGGSLAGDSYFSPSGSAGITFLFDPTVLGGLPTSAGLVWTDGSGRIEFEAFDAANNSLGQLFGNHANGSFAGQTDEDRFYGVVNPGGISSIFIRNTGGGIEIDHLQYGSRGPASANPIPEPATILLFGAGIIGSVVRKKFGLK